MMSSSQPGGKASLVMDQMGGGWPVFYLFEKALLKPIGISIHGGNPVT